MPVDFVRDTVEGLPEPLAKEYTKGEDGKFRLALNLPAGHKIEESDKLSNAVAATRRERDEAQKALKNFEGLDPAAARDALKQVEAWKKDGSPEQKLQQQIDQVKKEMGAAHGTELKALTNRLEKYQARLNKTLVGDNLRQVLAKEKANADLLMPHFASRLRIIENADGEPVLRVLTAEGNEAINADGSAKTLEQLVGEFKANPSYAIAFGASGNSGGGATGADKKAAAGQGGAAPKRIPYTDIDGQRKYAKEIAQGSVIVVDPSEVEA